MNNLRRAFVTILVCLSWTSCLAGPPFFTDDPVPVEYKHWEVYLASQYVRTLGNGSGATPYSEVNYGPCPNLQLHVAASAAFDHPSNGPTTYGFGDMELGAKYRFLQETDDRPQMAIYPLVELPTGDADRNLGNRNAQVIIPIWLQKSWGPWTSFGGGGYWINPGAGHRNGSFMGWEVQRDLSKVLTLGAEVFHRDIETIDGPTGTGFTAGGQVNFGDHYHLLFSAGRDFSGPETFTRYTAFQWTF